jgi:hypothetical protein
VDAPSLPLSGLGALGCTLFANGSVGFRSVISFSCARYSVNAFGISCVEYFLLERQFRSGYLTCSIGLT